MIQNIYEAANSCNLFFAILFSCLLIVDLKKPLFITQITLYKLEVIAVLVISFSSFFEIIYFIIKKYYVISKKANADYKDVYAEAYIGLLESIKNYNPNIINEIKEFLKICK